MHEAGMSSTDSIAVGQHLGLPGPDRREGHPAVAHHDRRHAVPARGRHQRVPPDLRIEMGVDVDEPRCHEEALGIDDPPGTQPVHLADRDDPVAVDRDIGSAAWRARSVDHGSTGDHQIMCHGTDAIGRTPTPSAGHRRHRPDTDAIGRDGRCISATDLRRAKDPIIP